MFLGVFVCMHVVLSLVPDQRRRYYIVDTKYIEFLETLPGRGLPCMSAF